jgi:hypothetical protein
MKIEIAKFQEKWKKTLNNNIMTHINITFEATPQMLQEAINSEKYKQAKKEIQERLLKQLRENPNLDHQELTNEMSFKLGMVAMQAIYEKINL